MKKNNYYQNSPSSFKSLNNILGNVVKDLGIDQGLRQITFLKFWPRIVGPRFEKTSRALSINKRSDGDILLVAVSSSAVSQELFMFKKDILKKAYPIAKALEFNIKDIVLTTKSWDEIHKDLSENSDLYSENYLRSPSDEELAQITIPEKIEESVISSVKDWNFDTEDLKKRMINTALKDIKLQIWKKNNNFPSCVKCGIPVNYRNSSDEILCPSCRYN